MNEWLGAGNGLFEYAVVLLIYGALFVVIMYGYPRLEPEYRKTFWILGSVWAVSTFIANYVLSLVGVMSFLPWVNNFIHTFIWIGLCLSYLYGGAYRKPYWMQFILFATFSLIVKVFEHSILHTWELNNFFGIPGNRAYILGWSLADGLYPFLSAIGLSIASKYIKGLIVPSQRPIYA